MNASGITSSNSAQFTDIETKPPTNAEISEQITSMEREAALEAAQTEKWKGAKRCYVRYGDLPECGRSRNVSTGELEAGVSVFRGDRLPTGEARALPRGYAELGSMLAAKMEGVPLYIVTGEEIGTGSDDEPVLADCRIISAAGNRI